MAVKSKVGSMPIAAELLEHVPGRRPVLQPLQVAVEAPAHVRRALVERHRPPGPRHRQRRGEARGTGAQDLDERVIVSLRGCAASSRLPVRATSPSRPHACPGVTWQTTSSPCSTWIVAWSTPACVPQDALDVGQHLALGCAPAERADVDARRVEPRGQRPAVQVVDRLDAGKVQDPAAAAAACRPRPARPRAGCGRPRAGSRSRAAGSGARSPPRAARRGRTTACTT